MCSQVPRLLQSFAVPFLPAGEESTAIRPFGFLTGFFFTVELKCELPDKEKQGPTFTQLPWGARLARSPPARRGGASVRVRALPARGLSRGAGCARVAGAGGCLTSAQCLTSAGLASGQ